MNLLRLRIPTLLALLILLTGLASGIYLTLQNQTISTKAAPETSPKSILVTNIEDESFSISWQTDSSIVGFINFSGGSLENQTALDDRDENVPTARKTHHVTLKELSPETVYQFKITSGKLSSEVKEIKTAKVTPSNGAKPIIGSVIRGKNPLAEGLVYLSIDGVVIQSTVIKDLGNFVIPLANIRKLDLSSVSSIALGSHAKISVIAEDGQKASATFILRDGEPLPPLQIGQDLDLTETLGVSTKDINGDGVINSFDLLQKSSN